MRINEIVDPPDQMALLQTILNSALYTIRQQAELQAKAYHTYPTTPVQTAHTPPQAKKPKAAPKPKKAPYAAAPKPLPKPMPQAPTAIQAKKQLNQNQEDYAQAVKKTLEKHHSVKLPKSLQPLPGNITNPIGSGDPELLKKLDQAKRQGHINRASGSEPQLLSRY